MRRALHEFEMSVIVLSGGAVGVYVWPAFTAAAPISPGESKNSQPESRGNQLRTIRRDGKEEGLAEKGRLQLTSKMPGKEEGVLAIEAGAWTMRCRRDMYIGEGNLPF